MNMISNSKFRICNRIMISTFLVPILIIAFSRILMGIECSPLLYSSNHGIIKSKASGTEAIEQDLTDNGKSFRAVVDQVSSSSSHFHHGSQVNRQVVKAVTEIQINLRTDVGVQKYFKTLTTDYLIIKPVRNHTAGKMPTPLLEIMFVVNAEAGMQPYISTLGEVITSLADRTSSLTESGIRIGLIAYRDRVVDYTQAHIDEGYNFGEPTAIKVFSGLTSDIDKVALMTRRDVHDALASSEEDASMGYDALIKAITETDWNKTESSLRLVCWITNSPAHEPGSVKNPLNISKEQLLKIASKNRIRFGCVAINGNRESITDLIAQMQPLSIGATTADPGFYSFIKEGNHLDFRSQLIQDLEDELRILSRLKDVTEKR